MIREICNDEVVLQGIKAFAASALQNLADAHDTIIEARTVQMHVANKLRKEEPRISIGDLIYLSTKNLSLPKGRACKLCPNGGRWAVVLIPKKSYIVKKCRFISLTTYLPAMQQ